MSTGPSVDTSSVYRTVRGYVKCLHDRPWLHQVSTGLSLNIGTFVVICTTIISLIRGIIYKRFWFSYILFIIIVGGMLVLFICMTRLASNEIFSPSNKLITITLVTLPVLTYLIPSKINNKEINLQQRHYRHNRSVVLFTHFLTNAINLYYETTNKILPVWPISVKVFVWKYDSGLLQWSVIQTYLDINSEFKIPF